MDGEWASLGSVSIPAVEVDVDSDGSADFEVAALKYSSETDLTLAATFTLKDWTAPDGTEYEAGDNVDLQPINSVWGDVDTSVFDNNVVVIPVARWSLRRGESVVVLAGLAVMIVVTSCWGLLQLVTGTGIAADGVRRATGPYLHPNNLSFFLERATLLSVLDKSARHLDRQLQLLEQGHQAPDHPVHPAIPETDYLKSVIGRVVLR